MRAKQIGRFQGAHKRVGRLPKLVEIVALTIVINTPRRLHFDCYIRVARRSAGRDGE